MNNWRLLDVRPRSGASLIRGALCGAILMAAVGAPTASAQTSDAGAAAPDVAVDAAAPQAEAPQANAAEPIAAEAEAAEAEAAEAAVEPLPPLKARSADELVRGVLNAQIAAWNEGDLEAFMAGYWNSPKLKMVSGSEVAVGWKRILKRYRDRYGDSADLGVLGFDKLDVTLISPEVAVAVGRYELQRDSRISTGAFTLVMRQFDGLWRIVHDHTVEDPRADAVGR